MGSQTEFLVQAVEWKEVAKSVSHFLVMAVHSASRPLLPIQSNCPAGRTMPLLPQPPSFVPRV